jgi:O-antigen/teichoic acid export membrane protein
VYGLGDAMTSLVSLFLLPVFTRYLSPADYGVITLLLTIEAVTKVAFRWGVDTAFMRLYYDAPDPAARQRLASTIFFFLLGLNGTLVIAAVASSGWLADRLIGPPATGLLVALTIGNTFTGNFFFIPYQVLRIGNRSKEFITITTLRSALTVVARLALVIWAGQGVLGIVLADVIVTATIAAILVVRFSWLIRPVFSRPLLSEVLAFGLPRVPHSLAHQVIGYADRYFLNAFGTLVDVGIYSVGATFGLALKLFLSSFESAWTPFFLAAMREPNAPRLFSTIATYVVAVLVLLVAGLSAVAPDLVQLFTAAAYHEGARVVPWIALGVLFQGFYLVGSIGLIISKRTSFYPISTGLAAVASVTANLVLIPRFGWLGAAWSNMIAYATLAAATSWFSWRLYPIPYEWSRLLRVAAAGAAGYWVATTVVPEGLPVIVSLLLHGAATVPVYALVLYVTGFFHKGEIKWLRDVRTRVLAKKTTPIAPLPETDAEMAGEIIGTAPEIDVSADSRDPRR